MLFRKNKISCKKHKTKTLAKILTILSLILNTFKTNLEAQGWDFYFIDNRNYFELLNFIVSVHLTCIFFCKLPNKNNLTYGSFVNLLII